MIMVSNTSHNIKCFSMKALPLYERSTPWVPTTTRAPHENIDMTHKSKALSNKTLQHHHFDKSKHSPQHMRNNLYMKGVVILESNPRILLQVPDSNSGSLPQHMRPNPSCTRLAWRMNHDAVTLIDTNFV